MQRQTELPVKCDPVHESVQRRGDLEAELQHKCIHTVNTVNF